MSVFINIFHFFGLLVLLFSLAKITDYEKCFEREKLSIRLPREVQDENTKFLSGMNLCIILWALTCITIELHWFFGMLIMLCYMVECKTAKEYKAWNIVIAVLILISLIAYYQFYPVAL